MAKGQFGTDTFEILAELGTSTAKKTVKSVKQTFSPTTLADKMTSDGTVENGQSLQQKKETLSEKSTPLDFENLDKKYKKQDEEQKLRGLRKHLHKLVKEGEQEAYQRSKQEEQQRLQAIAQEEEEKKKKEEERRAQEQSTEAPKGKERKNIFSPKKKAQQQHAETKPSTGKS